MLESAESEFLQELFINIRRRIGLRVCRHDVCNRTAWKPVTKSKLIDQSRHLCARRILAAANAAGLGQFDEGRENV